MAGIPFDSLVLAAVVKELQTAVGEHVNRVWTPDENTCVLKMGRGTTERLLLLSCDPRFFRIHFASTRGDHVETALSRILRNRIEGARITGAAQLSFDRVCEVHFDKGDTAYLLRAEFYGTRSNLILSENGKTIARTRKLKSPATSAPADLQTALQTKTALSPFLAKELELLGAEEIIRRANEHKPAFIQSQGAYPYSPEQLKEDRTVFTTSLSLALEMHYAAAVPHARRETKANNLRTQLTRALGARRAAIKQIDALLDVAARSRHLQMQAELLLAYAPQIGEGANLFEAQDYDGKPITIRIDPEAGPLATAEKLFQKAKRAKVAAVEATPRVQSLREQESKLAYALQGLDSATESELAEIEAQAKQNGWMREMAAPTVTKEERPYEGHRIRETTSPAGYRVLWGENATSNDYLTTRVAKPNDYWFHARGAHGAHVVLQTQNQPTRVQLPDLVFAAHIAAKNSGQKHASHVPVSYALAKYIRKPRKAAPGAVTMSTEKTLFVDP